jgi:hydrogenase maturation factor
VSTEAPRADCRIDGQEHCITCGDEGVVVRVLAGDDATALCVDGEGDQQNVAIELVAPVRVGDELLVHAGVAIRHLGAPA